jgi:hypothetical protein
LPEILPAQKERIWTPLDLLASGLNGPKNPVWALDVQGKLLGRAGWPIGTQQAGQDD